MTTTPLQEWMTANAPSKDLGYEPGYWQQAIFVRDVIASIVGAGTRERASVSVISTHKSKSVLLPVYEISRPDLGLTVRLRNNFYDWKISVESSTPVDADFSGLFKASPPPEPDYTGDDLSPVYFEGFSREHVFGYYDLDHSRWSASIGGDHALWTTVFLIMRHLGAVKPARYHTRASHRAELDLVYPKQSDGQRRE